ncbi:hypothetical protein JT358_17095 [Micrococcales bacterium 31B]|nr:hypothetical protein [Micrococcales bacterium 31B]
MTSESPKTPAKTVPAKKPMKAAPAKKSRAVPAKGKGEQKPPRNPDWRRTWVPHPDILGGGALLTPVTYPHNKDFRPSYLITGDITPDEIVELLNEPNGEELVQARFLEDAERRRQRRKKKTTE